MLSLVFSIGIASAQNSIKKTRTLETATFGNGCYWCTEAIFQQLEGVKSVASGFSGGLVKNPTYREVTTGKTGHAEVIQIKFDASKITFQELLDVFFSTHDPTTLNKQGYDVGSQYRSAIFYHNDSQKLQAQKIIKDLNEATKAEALTIITGLSIFTYSIKKSYI